jgi:hypothetical protein
MVQLYFDVLRVSLIGSNDSLSLVTLLVTITRL